MKINRFLPRIVMLAATAALGLSSCRPTPYIVRDQATPSPPAGETFSAALAGCVTSDTAPVRSGPNVDNYPVGTLARGASLLARGRSGDQQWYQVDFTTTDGKSQSGWIAGQFVLLEPASLEACLASAKSATPPGDQQGVNAFTPTGSATISGAAPFTPTPSPIVQYTQPASTRTFTPMPSRTLKPASATKAPEPYVIATDQPVEKPTEKPFVPVQPSPSPSASPAPSSTPKPTDVIKPPPPTDTNTPAPPPPTEPPPVKITVILPFPTFILKGTPLRLPTPTNTPNVTQGPPLPGTPAPGQ